MSAAVYALSKYSKYSTGHSGCWNVTDHTLNRIYSLEKFNPQQQLHLPPHPKRHPTASGDSSGFPAHRADAPSSCPSAVTPSYTAQPKALYVLENCILAALSASSFCKKKKKKKSLQSGSTSFKTIYAALIIFETCQIITVKKMT